jgi:hypothetical protein
MHAEKTGCVGGSSLALGNHLDDFGLLLGSELRATTSEAKA